MWWRSVSRARHAVVVGHAYATSRLTRHCSVRQGTSHWSGHVPSFPIRIEWGKGEGFLWQNLLRNQAHVHLSLS